MGHHWDDTNKVYFFHIKVFGKVLYNYDDTTEFILVDVEEQPVDDHEP